MKTTEGDQQLKQKPMKRDISDTSTDETDDDKIDVPRFKKMRNIVDHKSDEENLGCSSKHLKPNMKSANVKSKDSSNFSESFAKVREEALKQASKKELLGRRIPAIVPNEFKLTSVAADMKKIFSDIVDTEMIVQMAANGGDTDHNAFKFVSDFSYFIAETTVQLADYHRRFLNQYLKKFPMIPKIALSQSGPALKSFQSQTATTSDTNQKFKKIENDENHTKTSDSLCDMEKPNQTQVKEDRLNLIQEHSDVENEDLRIDKTGKELFENLNNVEKNNDTTKIIGPNNAVKPMKLNGKPSLKHVYPRRSYQPPFFGPTSKHLKKNQLTNVSLTDESLKTGESFSENDSISENNAIVEVIVSEDSFTKSLSEKASTKAKSRK